MEWPAWWQWELEISAHCIKRMHERGFDESELRAMLEDATGMIEQAHGTFVVQCLHDNRHWEVVVVPEDDKRIIVVVSAYPVA